MTRETSASHAPPGPTVEHPRELASYVLLPWRRLPFPIPWHEIFGRTSPLHVEVGFGDGRFTVRRAAAERDEHFVGLEISSASIQRARARIAREGTGNVRLVKAGAEFAVRHLFAPGSLASIVVNFPDPWPKERHAEHRLLRVPFYRLAASRLASGGEIRLATDHPEYLAFAVEEAGRSSLFEAHEAEPPAAVFETKYALKWRAQGKPLHYRIFRKRSEPDASFPVHERPTIMPHALLQGTLPSTIPFEKRVAPYGDGHVILHEAAASLGSEPSPEAREGVRMLVRATVDEPDLRQQLLIVVQQRSDDEAIVRIEPFGDPIITKTVRGAVHLTTEWLLEATDMALLARNY